MRHLNRLVILAALLSMPVPVLAQAVNGRVIDRGTDKPVPQAAVTVLDDAGRVAGRAVTDTAGRFSVELGRPGGYRLRAVRIGYHQVTTPGFDVAMREALEADVYLSAGAVDLEPLTITSRAEPPRRRNLELAGFYERERNAPGTFLRREEIERSQRPRMSDILAALPGVRRTTVQGRPAITLGRSGGGGSPPCAPSVFIDGQPLIRPEAIDDIVHVAAIEALEVYRGPSQTPARFAGGQGGCGVIVIWTQQRV